MKERVKGLVLGIIIGIIIATTGVLASTGVIQKELHYNDIKITLNGSEIRPTDVNGNYVEPFIIDGTTYLPVRGIASALGLNVDWDGETNTVILYDETYKTDIEKFVDSYGWVLEDSFEAGFKERGIECTATVKGEGNKIILDAKLTGVDNLSQMEKDGLQEYFNTNIEETKAAFVKVIEYIPSLEELIFNICEEDGDLIATINLAF